MPEKPTIIELVNLMNEKLNSSGKWSAFNKNYKYWRFLSEHCNIGSFYKPSDLPVEPVPNDYPDITQ